MDFRAKLTPQQYCVMREKGTEPAFTGSYLGNKKKGTYLCAACGAILFSSSAKFDSGTGWPSFFDAAGRIEESDDFGYGMHRTEIKCRRCKSHLGHVFEDGPAPTRKRYCVNSCALDFRETETAAFGAGCFWHVEEEFRLLDGVVDTEVGFMGGKTKDPSYQDVCEKDTGHAEIVKILFDKSKIRYKDLLEIFWNIHDPTLLDRQGNDIGKQYRSAIFYYSDSQKKAAEISKKALEGKKRMKIVTKIEKSKEFYRAEECHQKYYLKHSGCCSSLV